MTGKLTQILQEENVGLRHFTISGCHSFFGRSISAYCDIFFTDRLRFLEQSDQVSNILIAFKQENGDSADANSVINLANHLADEGKNVVLVLQAPILPTSIQHYLVQEMEEGDVAAGSRAHWEAMFSHVYNSLDSLDKTVSVVDLADSFCNEENCYAIRDFAALYFDDDHMSLAGARLAAETISKNDRVKEYLSNTN